MGPVDILINCAGFAVCGLFEETSVEDFKVNVLPKSLFIKIVKLHCSLLSVLTIKGTLIQLIIISSLRVTMT